MGQGLHVRLVATGRSRFRIALGERRSKTFFCLTQGPFEIILRAFHVDRRDFVFNRPFVVNVTAVEIGNDDVRLSADGAHPGKTSFHGDKNVRRVTFAGFDVKTIDPALCRDGDNSLGDKLLISLVCQGRIVRNGKRQIERDFLGHVATVGV